MMALVRLVWPVHAVAVFDVLVVEVEDDHGEDMPQQKLGREGDLHQRLRRPFLEQDQGAGRGVAGKDGEVDPAGHNRSAQRIRPSGAQQETFVAVCGVDIDALHRVLFYTGGSGASHWEASPPVGGPAKGRQAEMRIRHSREWARLSD